MPGSAQVSGGGANSLNIPADVTLLGKNDPYNRKATAVVNGQVITGTDVEQRVALLVAASEGEIPAEEMERLRMQVLRNLIDETLQIQEAKAQEIVISQAEIDQSYQRVAVQNFGQNAGQMDTYLAQIGSSPASLKRQIEGELAWQNLLGSTISPFINVSLDEVTELLERLEASRGTEEYRLGEIYLSATTETRPAVMENARRIIDQLREGGSFVAYARQFSEASTAAVGGDLGWLRLPQLPAELGVVAREMQPGQLVGPIDIPGGMSILYMIDKRQVLMSDPRDALLSLKQISIQIDPTQGETAAQQRVAEFTQAVNAIPGCGAAETAAAAMGADIVTNDQVQVRALPDALQSAMLQLQLGQVTPPFGSIEDGIRVLMLCGRDDPKAATGPSFDQLKNQLEEDRINKRATRYLRDLRNDALIRYN
ncbi:peptidylprolyl isomerase [Altererythrobacter sp. ZODW24]|uniref:peptidylprolyl isomerase n=1 Tax=Altererythrobacter sp. ZODW24 TaxID=2185142 RepID=UPI001F07D946|nr:peptidylprolyl isomerase [Altererythrobacter sp. ZODW24]